MQAETRSFLEAGAVIGGGGGVLTLRVQGAGYRKSSAFYARRSRRWVAVAAALLLLAAGCRQDMQNQPKLFPQRGTTLFADGRSVRPQVENTVARGQLHEDEYFYTGLVERQGSGRDAVSGDDEVLERGQERFNIYCTPCHSRVGNGAGMIVQRGYKPAGNFHDREALAEPLGHFFYVMTNGYRRHAGLCGAGHAGGSLGDRGVHPGAAAEPEREDAAMCRRVRRCRT